MTAPIVHSPLKEINRDEAGWGWGRRERASTAERTVPKRYLPNDFIRHYVDMTLKTTIKRRWRKKYERKDWRVQATLKPR